MGHRRFVKKKAEEGKKEHPYERTPNPQARNYYDEMAPVNGIVEYSQVGKAVFLDSKGVYGLCLLIIRRFCSLPFN